jgi:hypothetical protein
MNDSFSSVHMVGALFMLVLSLLKLRMNEQPIGEGVVALLCAAQIACLGAGAEIIATCLGVVTIIVVLVLFTSYFTARPKSQTIAVNSYQAAEHSISATKRQDDE